MTTTYDPKLHKIVSRTDLTDGMKDAAWEAFRDSNKPAPYNQVSDAVHAAISAAPEITLNQWQDISTAPKDGTRIWCFIPYPRGQGFQMETHWSTRNVPTGVWHDEAGEVCPTHWKPLDPPPTPPEN